MRLGRGRARAGRVVRRLCPRRPDVQGKRGKHRLSAPRLICPTQTTASSSSAASNSARATATKVPNLCSHPPFTLTARTIPGSSTRTRPTRHRSRQVLAIIRAAIDTPETASLHCCSDVEPCNTEDTEDAEGHRRNTEGTTRPTHPPLESSVSLCAPLRPSVLQAIEATLPTGAGQRHRRIFDLCRHLRAIPT